MIFLEIYINEGVEGALYINYAFDRDFLEPSPGRCGVSPLEGVADDTARWRVEARHDDVAEARGRPSPPPTPFVLP